jgi:hypothetical protein
MSDNIQVEDILKYLREQIGAQAQDIALLKATIDNLLLLQSEQSDKVK